MLSSGWFCGGKVMLSLNDELHGCRKVSGVGWEVQSALDRHLSADFGRTFAVASALLLW